MTKRALWKGRIRFADVDLPVKLYSALEEQRVHFRLLHRKDHSPVIQHMMNPESGKIIAHKDALKAFVTDDGDLVLLNKKELNSLAPESSREITIAAFLPAQTLDHRWYDRPYFLGPDGDANGYFTLTEALQNTGLDGLAQWTMHNRTYHGVLRLHQGYPLLIALRHIEELVPVEQLPTPSGSAPDKKELTLAKQLIGMLEAPFEPDTYHDEYRDSLLKLIEIKRSGGKIKALPKRRHSSTKDLSEALSASLKRIKKSA